MMGYDATFFTGDDDTDLVRQALAEGRVVLTRDSGIMLRRVVKSGRLRAVFVASEEPERQMRQIIAELGLAVPHRPFTLCLECNRELAPRSPEEVADRVPPPTSIRHSGSTWSARPAAASTGGALTGRP